jgi:hypothetical protein
MMSATTIAGAAVISLAFQATPGLAPLPADPPIGGPVWTVVIPSVLFAGSFLGTYLLYKRFAKGEQGGD